MLFIAGWFVFDGTVPDKTKSKKTFSCVQVRHYPYQKLILWRLPVKGRKKKLMSLKLKPHKLNLLTLFYSQKIASIFVQFPFFTFN